MRTTPASSRRLPSRPCSPRPREGPSRDLHRPRARHLRRRGALRRDGDRARRVQHQAGGVPERVPHPTRPRVGDPLPKRCDTRLANPRETPGHPPRAAMFRAIVRAWARLRKCRLYAAIPRNERANTERAGAQWQLFAGRALVPTLRFPHPLSRWYAAWDARPTRAGGVGARGRARGARRRPRGVDACRARARGRRRVGSGRGRRGATNGTIVDLAGRSGLRGGGAMRFAHERPPPSRRGGTASRGRSPIPGDPRADRPAPRVGGSPRRRRRPTASSTTGGRRRRALTSIASAEAAGMISGRFAGASVGLRPPARSERRQHHLDVGLRAHLGARARGSTCAAGTARPRDDREHVGPDPLADAGRRGRPSPPCA